MQWSCSKWLKKLILWISEHEQTISWDKLKYLVFFGCISLALAADASSLSKQLRMYWPRATWIYRQLTRLPVDKAAQAWKKLNQKPEKYFGQKDAWQTTLGECQIYEHWLSHTFVDGDRLVPEQDANSDMARLINLWRDTNERWAAFYVDCLSRYFTHLVKQAHQEITEQSFTSSVEQAKKVFEKMRFLVGYIKSVSYQLLLRRYREILDVLYAESLKARES